MTSFNHLIFNLLIIKSAGTPAYLADLLQLRTSSTRSATHCRLQVNYCSTDLRRRAFSQSSATAWNSLPSEVGFSGTWRIQTPCNWRRISSRKVSISTRNTRSSARVCESTCSTYDTL